MEWSESAWSAAGPVFSRILCHPFVLGLASGKLGRERFRYYIWQDSLYLKEYARVMSVLASRFGDPGLTSMFLGYATENLEAEKEMQSLYLTGSGLDGGPGTGAEEPEEASPTCLLCSSHLWRQAVASPLEVALASVLPCFVVYARTGRHIFDNAVLEGNPYRDWIEVYGSDGFDGPSESLLKLCDSCAAGASPEVRKEMTEAFVTGVKLEWLFWDSAYNMEKWKI